VIDLRTVGPLDADRMVESVHKTGRAVAVTEGLRTAGMVSEIAPLAQERVSFSMKAPVERVTGLDIVVPLQRAEQYYVPGSARIVVAARRTLEAKMALEFLLPDAGEGLTEAVVLRWLVPIGAEVGIDEPIVALEVDEAVVEMPAPRAGVVLHHGASEGETIAVGAILAVIGDSGETWADVEVAAAGDDENIERVPLSAARRAIARNLTRSWQEIPHVTTFGEADALAVLRARSDLAASSRDAVPLEALLIKAIIPVLEEFPQFNATLQGDDLLLHKNFDIGFAVDTVEGLMVAVVRHPDLLETYELGRKIVDLAIAARDRSIDAADLRGATFTVSNIGAVGGRYGTPIVPYGTTAILSVGRADPQPVVERDKVVVARRFPLSLSYDHRVIDGATGRRFLSAVAAAFEGYA